jgi:hypothetical protein
MVSGINGRVWHLAACVCLLIRCNRVSMFTLTRRNIYKKSLFLCEAVRGILFL